MWRVSHGVLRLSVVCAEPKRVTSMSDVARSRGPPVRRRERRLRAFWRSQESSPKGESQSNGIAGRAVQDLEGVCTHKLDLEAKLTNDGANGSPFASRGWWRTYI